MPQSLRRGPAARNLEENVLSERAFAAPEAAPRSRPTRQNPGDSGALLALILKSLDDDKAEEVVQIPLAGKSQMADHMVVASGRSSRQVVAIAEKMIERIKQDAAVIPRIEGREAGDWVLIDAGDVIVHLFRPEVREFYQLEKMWIDPTSRAPQG